MEIYQKIILLRKDRGLDQQTVATALNMTRSGYNKIEVGAVKITIDKLEHIANYYSLRLIDVITYPDIYIKQDDTYSSVDECTITFRASSQIKIGLLDLIIRSGSKIG